MPGILHLFFPQFKTNKQTNEQTNKQTKLYYKSAEKKNKAPFKSRSGLSLWFFWIPSA